MKGFLAALFALALTTPASADYYLSMEPAGQTVTAGQEFTIELRVPVADSTFNGIEATVGYDTTALVFVSSTIGPLMPSGCGNYFQETRTDTSRVKVFGSLLCSGVRLTGPGLFWTLRFRAKNIETRTVPLTFIPYACCHGAGNAYVDRTQFYRAGFYVGPLHTTEATVTILGPVGVGPQTVAPDDGKVYDVMGRRTDPSQRSGVTFGQRKRVRVK